MKLWSQLARLGAAVAALSPAVAEADDEPEQVEIPTHDDQPAAVASIGAVSVDPDANLLEDMEIQPKLYVAAQPPATQLPAPPVDKTPGPSRTSPKGGDKPHPNVMPHGKSWHGGGQRYGG